MPATPQRTTPTPSATSCSGAAEPPGSAVPDLHPLLRIAPWLLLILAAEFVNGWTDAPNAIATVVSTRVMRPHHAVLMAAVLNAAGAFAGTAVPATIGQGILRTEAIDVHTVGAAMMGIVLWSTAAWY